MVDTKSKLCPPVLHNILCRHFHRHCCYGTTHLNLRGNPSKRLSQQVEQADFLASGWATGLASCDPSKENG